MPSPMFSVNSETGASISGIRGPVYCVADERLLLCPDEPAVICDGLVIEGVTPAEMNQGVYLASHPDEIIHYLRLTKALLGRNDYGAVDLARVTMSRFRRKLGADELGHPQHGAFRTRHGVGFYAVSSLTGIRERPEDEIIQLADERIRFNATNATVKIDNNPLIELTPSEAILLASLTKKLDTVVTSDRLCRDVWRAIDQSAHKSLRVLIRSIRRHMGSELGDPRNGAIRTQNPTASRRGGYCAVSSLAIQKTDLSTGT